MADCNIPETFPKPTGFIEPFNNTNDTLIKLTAEDISNAMKREVWPVTILIGVEAILGIIGNTLIIIVYTMRYRRCNFKYFVLFMAFVDIASCFTTLPGEMISQLHWYNYQYEWICKIKSYFNVFTTWSSAMVLLLLAYDRYRKICRPLHWQIQPKWALRSCGISIVISGIVSTPIIVLWGKQSYTYIEHGQNITVTICEKSTFYADGIYPLIFIVGAYMAPIVIMIGFTYVLNFKIARAIFAHIPDAHSCNGLLLVPKSTEVTTVNEDEVINQMTHQRNGGTRFESNHRRHSITNASVSNGPLNHRLSNSMNLNNTCDAENRDISNIDPHSRDRAFTLDPSFEIHNYSGMEKRLFNNLPNQPKRDAENQSNHYDSTNCRANPGYEGENLPVTRLRSCSSSESSESYISKHTKRRLLSPLCNWKNQFSFSRRRISEADGCEVDSMVTDRPRSVRRVTKAVLLKRKTEIMLVLTTVFTITIIIYLVLSSFVADRDGILKELTRSEKVVFFFFWRFYFINCIINPVLYGVMDPRFRNGLKEVFHINSLSRKRSSRSAASFLTVV